MTRAAAFFDVDGTLLEGNIVRYYADLRTMDMPALRRSAWMAGLTARVPYYLALDAWSRARFQRALYRGYRHFRPGDFAARCRRYYDERLAARLFPAALVQLGEHRQRGDHVVLVTGSLEAIVAPLADSVQADAVVAARLEERGGAFTGRLQGEPITGARKAEAARDYARGHGFDLAHCHAYADSRDDLPLLRSVGHAHVVNPGSRLCRLAARHGWETHHWRAG